ncbi:hypothetical protein ACWDR3_04700 [Streptomyces sp. NPDC001002]
MTDGRVSDTDGELSDEEIREKLAELSQLAKAYAATVGRILLTGGVAALLVICARLFGKNSVAAMGLEAPLRHAWILFVAITVAHVFWAKFLADTLSAMEMLDGSQATGKALLRTVRTESGLMLRGLVPRVDRIGDSHVYAMSRKDPSTWLSFGLALSAYIAILPWRITHGSLELDGSVARLIVLVIVGLVALYVNWLIGGTWILMLSELANPEGSREIYVFAGSWVRWWGDFFFVTVFGVIFILVASPFVILVVF